MVANVLLSHGLEPEFNNAKTRNKLLGWDLRFLLNDTSVSIEVKFDKMAGRTGNIAIEYHNTKSNQPSGITATTADIWATVLAAPAAIWFTNVGVLQRYIDRVYPYKIVVGGDDNSAMKIYKKEKIFGDIFIRVDELTSEEFKKALERILKGDVCSKETRSILYSKSV